MRILTMFLAAILALTLGGQGGIALGDRRGIALERSGETASRSELVRPEGWQLPVEPPASLARAFERPPERWAPGHRGVDLRAASGSVVLSPRAGTVSFVGLVAGRGVVTITHPDGLRSSLEPVEAMVAEGAQVLAGEELGVLDARGSHCAPSSCVHWGVRDGTTYLDPLALLRGGPTVLLPGP